MSASALADVTNVMAKANVRDNDAAQRSRDAGWAEPEKYDYGVYNATAGTREERVAAEEAQHLPGWAANAQKYEWSDEYGDVGPRHEALEDMLFNNENINRIGLAFDK